MSETPAVSSFGPVAPYYDELMKAVPYHMWVSYYLLLLAHQDVHPRRILDVCCGTGTMCEMLTEEGFSMSGLDLSGAMIKEAERKASKKKMDIRYAVADASSFDMGETYDAALSFFDSLNNILDPESVQNVFHRVFQHLPSGGSWIFDLNTAYAFHAQLFDQQNLKANAKLKYKWTGDWDAESKVITVTMKFWRGGEEFEEIHQQRAYDEEEIREMLAVAGFEQIRVYHSYTLNPPRYKSDRLHYAAIKP